MIFFTLGLMMSKLRLFSFVAIALSLGGAVAAYAGSVQAPATGAKLSQASFSYAQVRNLSSLLGNAVSQDFNAINFAKIGTATFAEGTETSRRPEPEAWSMIILGAGFVVYQIRRRKRVRAAWDLR
jgi:hypothetical protein